MCVCVWAYIWRCNTCTNAHLHTVNIELLATFPRSPGWLEIIVLIPSLPKLLRWMLNVLEGIPGKPFETFHSSGLLWPRCCSALVFSIQQLSAKLAPRSAFKTNCYNVFDGLFGRLMIQFFSNYELSCLRVSYLVIPHVFQKLREYERERAKHCDPRATKCHRCYQWHKALCICVGVELKMRL